MKPVIAIPQTGNGFLENYMKNKYESSLNKSGADIRWIELSDIEKAKNEALGCDGLLLPGGADVSPALYGEKTEKNYVADALRDSAEPEIYKAFIDTGKPVLAICRGLHIINISEGGTLYQNISEIQNCLHMSVLTKNEFCHAVKIAEDSILYSIFSLPAVPVNSIHHQAIKKIGKNLKTAAISEDGFTEALEKKDYPFCIGVQWSPEHMYKNNPLQRKLFKAFVEKCS